MDVRVIEIERSVSREAVTLLRHRARHDANGWIGELPLELLQIRRSKKAVVNAQSAEAGFLIQDREGVEPILPPEPLDGTSAPQRNRGDALARVILRQTIQVIRLVRAMESAWAEVHDSGR